MTERRIAIDVPALTRVEGEGALRLRITGDRLEEVALDIFEPPRYFEKFLEGRRIDEVVDIVARICGICPVAYQMSAVQALERICGVEPGPWVRDMRRLFYCGEWLQSHALHIHLLAAPDFVGCDSVIGMAQRYPNEVRRGLRLQALGNDVIRLLGARSVHPVGARLGGFHRAPSPDEADALLARLRDGLGDAAGLLAWAATLAVPDDVQDFTCVALRPADGYPMTDGRIVSDRGLDIDVDDYAASFAEEHRAHSTALYSLLDGQPYLVGPLARLNLNFDRLPAATRALLDATGVRFPSRNMFHSLLARAVEIHVAIVEGIGVLGDYLPPDRAAIAVQPRAGSGCGATEAPRGLLWHSYDIDADGVVRAARIVPPTSQNQARIEADLRQSLLAIGLDNEADRLRLRAETVIRNYDPCISCATHFLRLRVDRT
jgi:sulfhydrogenase subunit alpha